MRTTNALERINEEFRRRTKTQASLPGQDAVLLLLFGLLRSGQVKLRKMDGWQEMAARQEGGVRSVAMTPTDDALTLFHHLTDTTPLGHFHVTPHTSWSRHSSARVV